ncbi:MAG TPA: zinc-binding dehydrogenase [Actinomycetota bacterium]|nr:zinc-binding dehydrogenase [Actinomycetota bacterium]
MKAAVLDEFGGRLRMERRPVPRPGPGEALIRVLSCGTGLTIEWARIGRLGGSVPRVLGHEYTGTVVEVGPGVEGWRDGDVVTGSFYRFCGHCRMCSGGRETLCLNFEGYIGIHVDGAFAEYVVVPARNLVPVPEDVPVREAGIIADAVATPLHVASRRAMIGPGDRVAVIGAGGGVGVHMAQVARAFGGIVAAVDRDPEKLKRLRELDFDAVVDASAETWPADVADAFGSPPDVVIDMVGSTETLAAAWASLGVGGRFVSVAATPSVTMPVEPLQLVMKEIVVTGTRYASRAEIAASLDLVRSGAVRCVIGARYPLDRVQEAMDAIAANEVFGRVLIDVAEDGA